MALRTHMEFKIEDFNSLNSKVKNILKQVSDSNKINIDFNDGMSLEKIQNKLNKLQQEVLKNSNQMGQTFTKSFDNVNKRLQQQIQQIENNLKNIGSNVNVTPIKDNYGKIIGAVSEYKDKTGEVIKHNYELGKSFSEINEKGKYIEKLKLVNDSDIKNQKKLLDFLEEEKKKIEDLNKTTAKIKVASVDGEDGKVFNKGIITYKDDLNRTVVETYKLKKETQELENVINKTFSIKKTTNYTDDIGKGLKTLEQYSKTINKLKDENFKIGNPEQNRQFLKLLEKANTLINKTASSGQSMSNSIKTSLDILVSKMNNYNKSVKEVNEQNKKTTKIQKDAEVEVARYETKINKLRHTYKNLIKDSDLSKLREEMKKLANSKDTETYSRQLKKIRNEYDKIKNTMSANSSTQGVGFFNNLKRGMSQLPIWLSAASVYMEVIHKVKEGIGYIRELDKAQTNISMITGKNTQQVRQLTREYSNLAGQLHSTTKEMMSGAEEFLRAGLRDDQVKGMLKASTIGSGVSGQSNEAMSQQLIAISNGFRMADEAKAKGEELEKYVMHVVDVISTLDNNSATSFQEIATALSRTSASAKNAGVDFDELSQMVAVVSATTRKSAESIGESFNVGGLVA